MSTKWGSLAQPSKPGRAEEGIHRGWDLGKEVAAATLGRVTETKGDKAGICMGKWATLAKEMGYNMEGS